jgi:hypothetical protein
MRLDPGADAIDRDSNAGLGFLGIFQNRIYTL